MAEIVAVIIVLQWVEEVKADRAGVLKVCIQGSKSEFFISVKGPDRNNWLLQNLFLINIQLPT